MWDWLFSKSAAQDGTTPAVAEPPVDSAPPAGAEAKEPPSLHEVARRDLPPEYFDLMQRELRRLFFSQFSDEFLATPDGQMRVRLQVYERMLDTETYTMPWIERGYPLRDSTVLEIGCGSGNSTVPMARRARRVIGWDIRDDALEIAKTRVGFFGLDNVEFAPVLPQDWIASAER
jgi:tRNA G46 methylase TrmB